MEEERGYVIASELHKQQLITLHVRINEPVLSSASMQDKLRAERAETKRLARRLWRSRDDDEGEKERRHVTANEPHKPKLRRLEVCVGKAGFVRLVCTG